MPQEDIEKSIDFYNEMIDDRMEDGLTEEEATAAIGPVNEIVSQILSETSSTNLVKAKGKSKQTAIVIAVIMIAVGLVAAFGAMADMGFDFTKMNSRTFVTNTYSVDESFSGISVDGAVSVAMWHCGGAMQILFASRVPAAISQVLSSHKRYSLPTPPAVRSMFREPHPEGNVR